MPSPWYPAGWAALAAAAATAPPLLTSEGAPVRRWKEGAPQAAPGRVLVRFKQTPAGARLGAALAQRPLPGLQLERLVGKHHTLQVPPPGSGTTSGGATISTAGTTTSGSSPSLPSDALMLFSVTDGSSVEAKVAQLRANPGGAGSLQAWWKPGASSTVQRWPCPPSSNCCRCLPACLPFLPAYQLLHFWQPASRGAPAMESICSLCGAC